MELGAGIPSVIGIGLSPRGLELKLGTHYLWVEIASELRV